jgi:hypothetical protein
MIFSKVRMGIRLPFLTLLVLPLLLQPLLPSLRAEPENLELKILVNQAGYDLGSQKHVLLQTNFDPQNIREFEVIRENKTVYLGKWAEPQKINAWDLWYRKAILPVSTPGQYVVRVRWQEKLFESPPFRVEADRLFRHTAPLSTYFFYAQRCGTEVPGWHGACHLDDGRMPDGSHRDLAGGWHDAGDYNKYNGYTPLAVYALSKLALSPSVHVAEWEKNLPTPQEEALWGARWLAKCQDKETKKIIGRVFSGFMYWGPPEDETDNVAGNEDDRKVDVYEWNENEMTVAAWASTYQMTGDPMWKSLAMDLWSVVSAHDPGSNLVQRAKRLLAATELFQITKDYELLEECQEDAIFLLAHQEMDGGWPLWRMAIVDYGLIAAALAKFALTFPESSVSSSVHEALIRYLNCWANRMVKPFTIPKWNDEEIFYPFLPNEWYVGQNSMYLSQAWAGLLISQATLRMTLRLRSWVSGCLDWIFGLNPFGICMMEGAGSVHLKMYHHRYDQIPNGKEGRIPGAICNGITRLRTDLDLPYLDLESNAWQTNEPWLPHNSYMLLVLSEWSSWERPLRKANREK